MQLIRSKDVIEKKPIDGANGSIVHGENLTTATWRFTAGTALPAHSHPHEQIAIVISGTLELTVSGETNTLTAGDHAIIPGNAEHAARAITDAMVVDAFYPVREDLR